MNSKTELTDEQWGFLFQRLLLQKRGFRLRGYNLLADVINGVKFVNGIKHILGIKNRMPLDSLYTRFDYSFRIQPSTVETRAL